MQSLVSPVDHESRRHPAQVEVASESTPLLHRFPQRQQESNANTLVIVSLLLIILIAGIIIGTYLLIIQSDSENVVPPLDVPLQLVTRSQWDTGVHPQILTQSPFVAQMVIVVQTDTEQCYTTSSCIRILNDIKRINGSMQPLPYNFLISSSGQAFEALGWRTLSPLFNDYIDTALVVAFIGNYTDKPLTQVQLQGAKNFFAESVSQQHLAPAFRIVVKNSKYHPKYLIDDMSRLKLLDVDLSDKVQ